MNAKLLAAMLCPILLLVAGLQRSVSGEPQFTTKVVIWGFSSNRVWELKAPLEELNLTNVASITADQGLIVALMRDGKVKSWGKFDYEELKPPTTLPPLKAVAAIGAYRVGLSEQGTLVYWGNTNWAGQFSETLAGLTNVAAVSVGDMGPIVLKSDGTVLSLESEKLGQPMPTGLSNVTAIASGSVHHLALKKDGTVVAWGLGMRNLQSQMESGQCLVPASATNVVAIAAQQLSSAAVTVEGKVIVWGDNNYSQLKVPPDLRDVRSVACSGVHLLALRKDGTVCEWGGNGRANHDMAQNVLDQNTVKSLKNVRFIAAGPGFSVAVVEESADTKK